MRDRTLLTGFLSFGAFDVNPSALLAQSCGQRRVLLEVTFDAVDRFFDELPADSFDRLLMLGVCGHASLMQLECAARNYVGEAPDVRGVVRGPGAIDPAGPELREGTLWNRSSAPPPDSILHHDAGSYLCNYAYYLALARFPGTHIGFLHVPPVHVMPIERQQQLLARLIEVHLQPAEPV
jgi:pyrrolidone-carboxylate peptidase